MILSSGSLIFLIIIGFTKYFKENCWQCFDGHFPFKYVRTYAFGLQISPYCLVFLQSESQWVMHIVLFFRQQFFEVFAGLDKIRSTNFKKRWSEVVGSNAKDKKVGS